MFSITETAKTQLLKAKDDLCVDDESIIRLGLSEQDERTFRLFIDQRRGDDYRVFAKNDELVLVIRESLMPKLEKTALDYDEHFKFIEQDN